MAADLLNAMLRAHSEAQAGHSWTDAQWAAISAELRPDDERVVAMRAVEAVVRATPELAIACTSDGRPCTCGERRYAAGYCSGHNVDDCEPPATGDEHD